MIALFDYLFKARLINCFQHFRMKDESAGEIPVAFVVRSNGSKITEEAIKKYISDQVIVIY